MKYLNVVSTLIALLLLFILLELGGSLKQDQKALIAADQSLEKSITSFSKQIDPIVKRFGR